MSLATGREPFYPASFARHENGYLHIADGVNLPPKWNGISSGVVNIGVAAPAAAATLAAGAAGNPNGTYYAYLRFVDDDGNVSNLSPISLPVTVSNEQIDYSGLPTSVAARVAKLQILRNTAGQVLQFFVDVEQVGSYPGTDTSDRTDEELAQQEQVFLFDGAGNSLANRYSLPPSDKPIVVYHRSRLFWAGHVRYQTGHVEVTNGSDTVVGIGTHFTDQFVGRFLHVNDHDPNYTIQAVDTATQTLTLTANYAGSTNKFALYRLESAPGTKNQVIFSNAGQPDSYYTGFNSLEVGASGDEITAMVDAATYLYIVQNNSIHRLTYSEDPFTDGGVYRVALRGSINQRTWVRQGAAIYFLDSEGIYRFTGVESVEEITPPLQDLFWRGRDGETMRIDWTGAAYFHAVTDPAEKVIRWFISLGARYPTGAIALDYIRDEWWLETYPVPLAASSSLTADPRIPVVGGPAKKIFAVGYESLDVARPADGKSVGEVTSAGVDWIADTTASFPATHVGAPLAIIAGRGKGQVRRIVAVSGGTLQTLSPWTITPDATSQYQVGAIRWRWRSKRFRYRREEQAHDRGVHLHWSPLSEFALADLRLYLNHDKTPLVATRNAPRSSVRDPLVVRKGSEDGEIDLRYPSGYAQRNIYEGGELSRPTVDAVSIELRGFAGSQPLHIHDLTLTGVADEEEPRR